MLATTTMVAQLKNHIPFQAKTHNTGALNSLIHSIYSGKKSRTHPDPQILSDSLIYNRKKK